MTTVSGAMSYSLDVAADSAFSSLVQAYKPLKRRLRCHELCVMNLTPGTLYYYRVRAVARRDQRQLEYRSSIDPSTAAQAFTLSRNYPNPFNPEHDRVPGSGAITCAAERVRYSRKAVKTLVGFRLPRFRRHPLLVLWDGNRQLGHGVASGVYFYRMDATGCRGRRAGSIENDCWSGRCIRVDRSLRGTVIARRALCDESNPVYRADQIARSWVPLMSGVPQSGTSSASQ